MLTDLDTAALLRLLYTTDNEHIASAVRAELSKRGGTNTTYQERHDKTYTW